jgi:phage terminase large subunit-like protein
MAARSDIPAGVPAHFRYDFITTLHFYKMVLTAAAGEGAEKLRQVKRRLGETDLFFLLVFVLNRPDIMRAWLFDRCREFQRDPDDRLDLWAREHYKSTIITFGGNIFEIIRDPEITIGIFSHTKSIARDFLRQIKTELETNSELPLLWPEIFYAEPQKEAERWSLDGGINVKRRGNPKEATVEGHGLVDGMPTSRHFALMDYDDVVTPESVSTPEQIAKTTAAFQMSDNLGAVGGRRRYVGTFYHLFDTYSEMIDLGVAEPRIHPATSDGTEFGPPVLLSAEELARKRVKQGHYIFHCQMLLNPIADASMGFRREWLVFGDTDYNAAMSSLWRLIIVDPASGKDRKKTGAKKGKDTDYTTFWVIGHGADGLYRVLDMRRDRMSLTTRCETLMDLHKTWKPGLVAYEEYGMQADIEHIEYVQEQRLYKFDITPIGGPMRKELRILRLVPLFENGYKSVQDGGDGVAKSRIILPTSCLRKDATGQMRDLVKDFMEQEYVAFPVLKHDDMIDGLARIVDLDEKGLILKPTVSPAQIRGTKVEEGLRKLGQKGAESWLTA